MFPSILAAIASTTISMSALAAAPTPHAHLIADSNSRAALVNTQSFSQVLLGDTVEMSITLQDGSIVDLDLKRFTPFTSNAKIVSVDDKGIEHTIDLSNDVHLRGHVAGDKSKIVYIGISPFGTTGFLEFNNDTHIISSGKFTGTAKTSSDIFVMPANDLSVEPLGLNCGLDTNNPMFNPLGLEKFEEFIGLDGQVAPLGANPARDAKIALETDYEFTDSLFGGNTTASASYASSLLAAISTIYSRDVNMTLSVPFLRTYASNNDPYGGSGMIDFLDDVQTEFTTGPEADIERTIVQGLSGRGIGGGVAYLATACNDMWGIGVSASLNGFFPNPLQDNNSNNWDILVVSHEMGHNFGTGHTHDAYDPPIDNCGNGDCSQAMNSTLMSYCHGCSGGLSNLDMRFHPRVQTRILSFLDSLACDLTVSTSPCPADINGDGVISFPDVSAFIAAFQAGDLAADFNGDGTLSFPDVSAFIAAFQAGCP